MNTFFKVLAVAIGLGAVGYGCYSAGKDAGYSDGFSTGRSSLSAALSAMNKAVYERNIAQFEVEWLRGQLDRAPRLARKEVQDDLRAIWYSVSSEAVRSAAVDSYISGLKATEEHALRFARNLFESAVEELRLEKNNGVGYSWVANPISARIAEEPVAELLGWSEQGSYSSRARAALMDVLSSRIYAQSADCRLDRLYAKDGRRPTLRFGIIDPNRPE